MSKAFWRGDHKLPVLDEVALTVGEGDFVAVHGERRAGKTTLLSVAAGLMPPDAGSVRFRGHELARMSPRQMRELRAEQLSWVAFDDDALVTSLRASEYVGILLGQRWSVREAKLRAGHALAQVGAEHCRTLWWDQLPDLERVLVKIAGALARGPELLLIDEPTVGLDPPERERVLGLLRTAAETAGTAVVMAVADKPAARAAHHVRVLRKGRLLTPVGPSDDGGRVIRFPGGP